MSFGFVLGNIVQGSHAGKAFQVGVMTKNSIASTDRKNSYCCICCQKVEEKKKRHHAMVLLCTLPGHHYIEMVVKLFNKLFVNIFETKIYNFVFASSVCLCLQTKLPLS